MAPNFASLLNKPADEVKRPVTLPDGTYYATITSHELGESAQKKTPFVRYQLQITHADEETDVEGIEVAGKKMRQDFYITDESTYRLIDFLGSLGVETAGRTLGETIPQAIGQTVMIDVVRKPNERNPDEYYNEVRKCVGLAQAEPSESEQVEEAQGRRRRS